VTSLEHAFEAIDEAYRAVCALGVRDADPDRRAHALIRLSDALESLRQSQRIMAEQQEREEFRQWKAARDKQKVGA
jgi:hypothetical protein